MAEEGLDSEEEREIERQEQEEDEAAYEPEFGAQDDGEPRGIGMSAAIILILQRRTA